MYKNTCIPIQRETDKLLKDILLTGGSRGSKLLVSKYFIYCADGEGEDKKERKWRLNMLTKS